MSNDNKQIGSDREILAEKEYKHHDDHSPAEVIIEAVAEAADTDPLELSPMHDFIDPDAVNRLFRGNGADNVGLSFRFDEWTVSVRADGIVRVRNVRYSLDV